MLSLAVLVFNLCACGGQSETNNTEPKEQETILTTEATQKETEPTTENVEASLNDVSTSQASEETPNAIPIQCGDSIDNDNFLMTFDSMELFSEYSYDTSEYVSHSLYVENGYKLIIVKGHFENKSTAAISDRSFALSAVVNNTYVVDGFDVYIQFLRDKSYEIDAYTDLDYVLYIQIPEKLADMFETATFSIGFNDDLSTPTSIWNDDGTITAETDNLYEFTSGISSN